MRAILFNDQNKLSITEVPDPHPEAHEVVVEIHASGICHTDIEVLRGNYGTSAFPVVPGHEYAGVIIEVGKQVEHLQIGDRVVVDPNLECGNCRPCKRGWAHLCENLGAYGVTQDGGFAEKSLVQAAAVHPIGDMPFHIAALAEPMGCVLNGLSAARVKEAQNALIFGAGPMGLLLAIGLSVEGVDEITIVDIDKDRLALAESFGFHALAAGGVNLDVWHQNADLVADATGVPTVAEKLIQYVANGGVGLFFGVCPSDVKIGIAPFELFRRQISLVGSHSLNHNIPEALAVLRAYGDGIENIISHKVSLEDVANIMEGHALKGSLKVQWERNE